MKIKCTWPGCNKEYKKERYASNHYNKSHLGLSLTTCYFPECNRTFKKPCFAREHFADHDAKKLIYCSYCSGYYSPSPINSDMIAAHSCSKSIELYNLAIVAQAQAQAAADNSSLRVRPVILKPRKAVPILPRPYNYVEPCNDEKLNFAQAPSVQESEQAISNSLLVDHNFSNHDPLSVEPELEFSENNNNVLVDHNFSNHDPLSVEPELEFSKNNNNVLLCFEFGSGLDKNGYPDIMDIIRG